jgi:hypothetical protein
MKIHLQKTGIYIMLIFVMATLAPSAWAVPMWSRRYSVPCSVCHSFPSLQLTSTGIDFFRKGHRFDKDTFDKDFGHLLAAHVETELDVEKGTPTQFMRPDFHFHAGGALSDHFSTYVDAMMTGEFEAVYGQGTWATGKESFFTARVGKFVPSIIRNYADGLMASASSPMIITDSTLGPNPFTPTRDSFGVTVANGWKSLFVEAGVINGEDIPGQAMVNRHKDAYASGEIALPDGISGFGVYYYRGGYDIVDPNSMGFDRYDRTALFANFTRDKFRVAGAWLTGKDSIDTQSDQKITGYYVQADLHASDKMVPFARYEYAKTDNVSDAGRQRKGILGCAFTFFETDSSAARVVAEVARNKNGGDNSNSALLHILWAF